MEIAVIGQGGHSKVIEEIILSCKENKIIGYFDDKFQEVQVEIPPYYGQVISAKKLFESGREVKFVIAIGNNQDRKKIAEQLKFPSEAFATIIHNNAVISASAKIREGCVIMANSVINADTEIGCHTIINTGSIIEHENNIGDFVHISPGATLAGSVNVEDGVHIGSGATVIPNIRIEEWAVIGAGATVISNIPSFTTAVGIPARAKEKIMGGGV